MTKLNRISYRLTFSLLAGVSVIYLVVSFYYYQVSKRVLLEQTKSNIRLDVENTVWQIRSVLKPVFIATENSALLIKSNCNLSELQKIQQTLMNSNVHITGCGVYYEPYSNSKDSLFYSSYIYFNGNSRNKFVFAGNSDYFHQKWYNSSRETGKPFLTEPHPDAVKKIITCTYIVPIYKIDNGHKTFNGVVSVDIELDWLYKLIKRQKSQSSGYSFILSDKGNLLVSPDSNAIIDRAVFHLTDSLKPKLTINCKPAITANEKYFPPTSYNKKEGIYIAPVFNNQWYLARAFPIRQSIRELRTIFFITLFSGLLGFTIIWFIIMMISRKITRPLVELSTASRLIRKGNYNAPLPVTHSTDEVAQITKSFQAMQIRMKRYIKNFKETLEDKRSLDNELKIANHIQANMLPHENPPFPDHKEFELYSNLTAANGVAGDFYDYYFLDKERLFFIIGDVSGKGVPASLFMVRAITLLKIEALTEIPLDQIMFNINNHLALNNEESMFVTAICGTLDIITGELNISDAGHNPPVFSTGGKSFEFHKLPKNMPFGIKTDTIYQIEKVFLKKNDTLLLYTDGVTEARNLNEEQFTQTRLLKAIKNKNHLKLNEIVHILKINLEDFVQEAKQSDDITFLMLRFTGGLYDKETS